MAKTLLQKILELQTIMGEYAWEKDGINRHQSYKYVTEKQYKQNFKKALKKVGLIWKMETISKEYIPDVTDKQHMVLCDFKGQLIDPETGEREEYLFSGSGADSGDKALYKAVTGGHKYFLASNFNVSEDNDPEDDTEEVPEVKKPADPVKREAVKRNLTNSKGQATKMQITALKKTLAKLRELDKSREPFIADIAKRTKGFEDISKEAAEKLIITVGEMITTLEEAK